jgi:hypothetical protein
MMILTEEQRRWWFANHPEFSGSHRGGRPQRYREASSTGHRKDDLVTLAGYAANDGLVIPRLPTTDELSRWPRDLARQFFRILDATLQNNPLVIDPNALEGHHGLPKDFIKYFLDCGINIEEFVIIMRVADHRLKPKGVHTGKGRGGDWNREWEDFIEQHPPENSKERQSQISDKLKEMIEKYGIDKKAILLPEKAKRW